MDSPTWEVKASNVHEGAHVVIKGRPCTVLEVSTTGEEGGASPVCHFTAVDMFTGKPYETELSPSDDIDVPRISRNKYQLARCDGDKATVRGSDGSRKQIPVRNEKVADRIREYENIRTNIYVTVLEAMGEEGITEVSKETY